ncbi:MAG: hypothetical protein IPN29_04430 [Saprospiraceae bacterium]|nr:hypothetical protein [Saprospiraceae bacterium]
MAIKKHLLTMIFAVAAFALYGQCTYTTFSAGDYFTAGNWVNGLQPPNPIPNGVTVTLTHAMNVSGVIENNGFIIGTTLTIQSGGGYGGKGTFAGIIVNNGAISPGIYAPFTIVNTQAGLTTTAASGITASGGISGGQICHDGGTPVIARGVCYGTDPNPEITGPKTTDGAGAGAFVSTLSGLSASTLYYIRAYATNGVGTSYGQEISFTTASFPCGSTLTYGGEDYNTVLIGSQCWMAENLNIGTMINGATNQTNNLVIEKYCYNNDPAQCTTFGGLYQWDEMMQYTTMEGAKGLCPTGWHLPSFGDWTTLTTALSRPDKGSRLAGNAALWANGVLDSSPNFGTSGFVALPAGLRLNGGTYSTQSLLAIFWSSTENGVSAALNPYLFYTLPDVIQSSDGKVFGFSVRCVQD